MNSLAKSQGELALWAFFFFFFFFFFVFFVFFFFFFLFLSLFLFLLLLLLLFLLFFFFFLLFIRTCEDWSQGQRGKTSKKRGGKAKATSGKSMEPLELLWSLGSGIQLKGMFFFWVSCLKIIETLTTYQPKKSNVDVFFEFGANF